MLQPLILCLAIVLTDLFQLWQLYNKFPTPTSQSAAQQIKLRREIVRLKRELNNVSAQDEFPKWAKLQRQHDKAIAEYDKLSTLRLLISLISFYIVWSFPYLERLSKADVASAASSLQSSQSSFDTQFNVVRMVCTHGLRLFIQWFYNRTPLFWIPKGWLPFYAEWLLSFPMAPRGSISIYIWSIACGSVIKMVSDALVAVFVLAVGRSKDTTKVKAKVGQQSESKKVK